MIRLFQFIIFGHIHEWEDTSQSTYKTGLGYGPIVYCKCKKCGEHRSFRNATMKRPPIDNQ